MDNLVANKEKIINDVTQLIKNKGDYEKDLVDYIKTSTSLLLEVYKELMASTEYETLEKITNEKMQDFAKELDGYNSKPLDYWMLALTEQQIIFNDELDIYKNFNKDIIRRKVENLLLDYCRDVIKTAKKFGIFSDTSKDYLIQIKEIDNISSPRYYKKYESYCINIQNLMIRGNELDIKIRIKKQKNRLYLKP